METIRNYLDNMFRTLPRTAETIQMKEELLINMEDKYNELRDEGKSENEAVGIVIAEFGNIDELAKELNIDLEQPGDCLSIDLEEVESFIDSKKKSAMLVAAGVSLIIAGAAILILFSSINTFSFFGNGFLNDIGSIIGLCILLLFVGAAVGLFIYSNSFLEPFKYIMEGEFHLTIRGENYVKTQKELYNNKKTFTIISSVLLFILSPIALFIATLFNNDMMIYIGLFILLLLVAVGVANLIIMSGSDSAYQMLLKIGEYSVKEKEENKVIAAIAAVWWPVVICIYLFWSFRTGSWGFTWIIWPISALLFGAVSGALSILTGNNHR